MAAWLPPLLGAVIAAALAASVHAVLCKRDSRATILWVALICGVPVLGPALYLGFGINRINRKAARLARDPAASFAASKVAESASAVPARHASLAGVMDRVTARPLLPGNRVDPLDGGAAAYPAMLETIAAARKSVALCTYIFERDAVGLAFAQALGEAVRRGVEVRVLIDATGTLFSWPSIAGVLRKARVPYARFLPPIAILHPISLNIRTHRKLLIVDGRVGFTGGMNILEGQGGRKRSVAMRDLHFRVSSAPLSPRIRNVSPPWRTGFRLQPSPTTSAPFCAT